MPGGARSFLMITTNAKTKNHSVRRAQARYSSLLLLSITLAFAVAQVSLYFNALILGLFNAKSSLLGSLLLLCLFDTITTLP